MRRLVLAAVALLAVGGCGLVPVQNGAPVPPGPLGPVVPAEGGGPPVECRGVPVEQCRGFASRGEADVVRYIVTCTSACTPEKGDVRIDILGSNGTTRSAGGGSYSAAEAAPVPAPAATELRRRSLRGPDGISSGAHAFVHWMIEPANEPTKTGAQPFVRALDDRTGERTDENRRSAARSCTG